MEFPPPHDDDPARRAASLLRLLAELIEQLSAPARPAPQPAVPEPSFLPGGEGITVVLVGVPNFQILMDIRKAFVDLSAVAEARIQRYTDSESRILLDLNAPVTASDLIQAIRDSTGLNAVVDDAHPEHRRLKVRIQP